MNEKQAQTPAAAPAPSFKTYSLDETAAILGIAPRTMHDYIKTGRIKAQKIGGHWRISEKNLQNFIDGD